MRAVSPHKDHAHYKGIKYFPVVCFFGDIIHITAQLQLNLERFSIMARLVTLTPNNTYATEANAIRAVEAKFPNTELRYFLQRTELGRFFPVFVGERAMLAGVHFHFNCIN